MNNVRLTIFESLVADPDLTKATAAGGAFDLTVPGFQWPLCADLASYRYYFHDELNWQLQPPTLAQ